MIQGNVFHLNQKKNAEYNQIHWTPTTEIKVFNNSIETIIIEDTDMEMEGIIISVFEEWMEISTKMS